MELRPLDVDSRVALAGSSLPRSSVTHVKIAAKTSNVIETFFGNIRFFASLTVKVCCDKCPSVFLEQIAYPCA